jgi:serine/threonine-protein kinase
MGRWLVLTLIFVLTAVVVFWQALVHTLHLGTVVVPKLTAVTAEEAARAAHDLGLMLAVDEGGAFSAEVEAGQVAEQEPLPGYHVKTGSTVTVRLSRGSRRVMVPTLAGESVPTAQRDLDRLGLAVGPEVVVVGQSDDESILTTQPRPGSEVAPGTQVALLVNATPHRELWVMPSLLSLSATTVKDFCRRHHLRLGHQHEVVYPGLASDTVLRQYPPAGSPLSRSDIITVWVAR